MRLNIDFVAEKLKRRGFDLDVNKIRNLEEQRASLQKETQRLQNERNVKSKNIGQAKIKGINVDDEIVAMSDLNEILQKSEEKLSQVQDEIKKLYDVIPNIPHDSVPDGLSQSHNREVARWGDVKKYDFDPKDHTQLGESLGMMDFEDAAKISGSRFVILKNQLVEMQRALTQFMLDLHTKEHGYEQLYVPYIVNAASLYGTGNLPKFRDDLFNLEGENNFSLIPTAEVPVTNLVRDKIVKRLPLKYVAHTPCFRSEAGSYGKDMKGMIRQHQFEKVEIVQMVEPEKSYEALEELTSHAERVLQKLELPYRKMALCAGDMGFSSAKTYDLEVWLPGQGVYREISSCSNFESFQARRMNARWKNPGTNKTEFLNTLNGSGLAVGRTLIAVMENYQDKDGNILVPKVLKKYMDVDVVNKK